VVGAATAIAYSFTPGAKESHHRWIALGFTTVLFLISLLLLKGGGTGLYQFEAHHSWIASIGARYHLGIDGISLWLVLLTTLLMPISVLSSWTAVAKRQSTYYALLLLLESAMIGVFVSLDLLLFYLFFEASLVPMFFLIGIWGGERRIYAAVKFFIYTAVGSLLMLVGIIALYFIHQQATGVGTFDYTMLMQTLKAGALPISPKAEFWLFLAFAFAFCIKVPLWPLHTWLPDAHTEAPTAGSVILAGVLLKMGGYGLIRFAFPLFPAAALYFAPLLATLSVIAIVYGALVAMVQPDLKKLVAYSSVSHMGFVVLGIAAMNVQGVQGAAYQMLAHGVSTGALFCLVGMLSDRRHTRLISEFGGLKRGMPQLTAAFLVITLSSVGLPGMNGFIGEFLIMLGAFKWDPRFVVVAALGVILSAVYMLWMFQRVFFGPVTNDHNAKLPDLSVREWAILGPLAAMAIVMGVVPNLFLKPMEPAVQRVVERVQAHQPLRVENLPATSMSAPGVRR
jgi:NADH-quinone oxidoreductase subunit M